MAENKRTYGFDTKVEFEVEPFAKMMGLSERKIRILPKKITVDVAPFIDNASYYISNNEYYDALDNEQKNETMNYIFEMMNDAYEGILETWCWNDLKEYAENGKDDYSTYSDVDEETLNKVKNGEITSWYEFAETLEDYNNVDWYEPYTALECSGNICQEIASKAFDYLANDIKDAEREIMYEYTSNLSYNDRYNVYRYMNNLYTKIPKLSKDAWKYIEENVNDEYKLEVKALRALQKI